MNTNHFVRSKLPYECNSCVFSFLGQCPSNWTLKSFPQSSLSLELLLGMAGVGGSCSWSLHSAGARFPAGVQPALSWPRLWAAVPGAQGSQLSTPSPHVPSWLTGCCHLCSKQSAPHFLIPGFSILMKEFSQDTQTAKQA